MCHRQNSSMVMKNLIDATSNLSPTHMLGITHLYMAQTDRMALCLNHVIGTDNHKLQ